MSAADFFASSRVLIVAGKGGVGKTTVGATVGIAAAQAGLDVLLVELEGLSNLAAPFGLETLSYDTTTLLDERVPGPDADGSAGGRLRARQITPDEALADYLDTSGLRVITDRMARSGAVELVATTAPGIRDLVTLGKIRQLDQAGDAELIVVDAPAAGHAVTFLQAASGLAESTPTGPVRQQAELVLDLLGDADRCQVLLVTVPEETPVTEVVETAFSLEDRVGVALGPVVVNACWPMIEGLEEELASLSSSRTAAMAPTSASASVGRGQEAEWWRGPWAEELARAARYRLARIEHQRAAIDRLCRELPLPTIELPFLFDAEIDRAALDVLADSLSRGAEALAAEGVDQRTVGPRSRADGAR